MSFLTKITLTTAGQSTGPFNIYQNSDNYVTALDTNVSLDTLTGGTYQILVNDNTTTVRVRSMGVCTNSVYIDITGIPSTPTPTPTLTMTPSPAPLGVGVSSIYLSSGTTVANACTGTTQLYYYETGNPPTIPNFGYDGKQIYTDSSLLTPAPGTNLQLVYYYSSDYNTVYYVNDSEGRKYDSNQICPTPTPTTGTIINAVVSLVDGPTACDGGDYGDVPSYDPLIDPLFFTLTIYGSNIVNASAIINIPNTLLADFTTNQEFYVRGRVAPNFYWKKFILDGSPGSTTTATASGAAVLCT